MGSNGEMSDLDKYKMKSNLVADDSLASTRRMVAMMEDVCSFSISIIQLLLILVSKHRSQDTGHVGHSGRTIIQS